MPDLRDFLSAARHRAEDAFNALSDAEALAISPGAKALLLKMKLDAEAFDNRLWVAVEDALRYEGEAKRNAAL